MRLGLFLAHGSAQPSGHRSYQDAMLAGLLAQERHQIVVLASERDALPDVPPPHELVRVAHPRQRLAGILNLDVHAEGVATLAAQRARLDAIVGNGHWGMPRPLGVPRIVVLYEAVFLESAPWGTYSAFSMRQLLMLPRRNLRNARAVICISEHGRRQIAQGFGLTYDVIGVAPPAVGPFRPADSSPWQPSGPYVMTVGWFHPRKRVMLALRSWRRAVELGLDADFVLAGTEGPPDRRYGSMGRRILEAVGKELSGRVHYTGSIPRADLGVLYRGAQAVLITSMHEGFGIPAIEAFSMGVPVVAVAATSLPEVAGPVGAVVEADADALGAALLDVCLHPPDKRQMVEYAARFTVERQVAPILAAADRIAASRTKSRRAAGRGRVPADAAG